MIMSKHILIHTCCAPCLCYPYKILTKDYKVTGYWYNPNIHGYREYEKRLMTAGYYSKLTGVDLIIDDYSPSNWLKNIGDFSKEKRCVTCYRNRLEKTVLTAQKKNINFFTTTLLYSKFQDHNAIKNIGVQLSKKYKPDFFYQDFRQGWKEGINISKKLKLYRQEYCGCLLSEQERYGVS